ncbi:MAG: PilZ domain-containing protein [Novosphingobium sp.]|nr:PilZ domain-containing protein [Novosphingobium sp.]
MRPDDECTRASKTRATVNVWCEVRQGTRPWKRTRLEDISPEGFRIGWLPGCHADTPLRIRIPGMQVLTAEIRWKRGDGLGCKFASPLHVAVFEHIVRQSEIGG